MKTTPQFDEVISVLRSKMEVHEGRVKYLASELARSPIHALRYSCDGFESAAKLGVFGEIVRAVDKPGNATMQSITKFAHDQVLRCCSVPSRSTSVTANLMDQMIGVAWAEAYEYLAAVQK